MHRSASWSASKQRRSDASRKTSAGTAGRPLMKSPHDIVEVVSLWMARIGGLMLLGASVVITVEILLRKLFFLPFSIGTELSTYALAISGSWSFSYALLNR